MDLQQITDINQLKALAYDQTLQLQLAQNNLQALQLRIQQVEREMQAEKAVDEAEAS